jgi:hypothetical protein
LLVPSTRCAPSGAAYLWRWPLYLKYRAQSFMSLLKGPHSTQIHNDVQVQHSALIA